MQQVTENHVSTIQAIDVHGHVGQYHGDDSTSLHEQLMSGDAGTIVSRATAAHTTLTVVSPLRGLLPRGGADAVAGNEEAARIVEETDGLLQWVIVNPLQPQTFEQALAMLQRPKCVGIKMHPEEHCYPVSEHGRAVFEFAAKRGAVVQTHSGDTNSLPADFVPFADEFPELTLILGHLGYSGPTGTALDLQVRAIQASRHGNLFVDTSSIRSTMSGLIEWAAHELGADRLLFGTDTPLYFAPSQRARIDKADLSDSEKRLILRGNAERLLGLG